MLTFVLKNDHYEPLYRQLYQQIRREIMAGNLKTGEKLASKRQMAEHLKISQNTVAAAYDQLVAEGYIEARPRSGFYVSPLEDVLPDTPLSSPPSLDGDYMPDKKEQWEYDFVTNTVDASCFPFPTWAKISRQVLSEEDGALLKAVDPRGYYPLRKAIVDYVHQYRGVRCTPEQVIVGAGSEYLLGLAVQLIGRDQLYAMENPNYEKVYRVLQSAGVSVSPISLDQEGLSITHLRESGASVVHTTPSHQFPLGIVMPLRRRMALLKWAAEERGRYILEDDYDSEFRFKGRPIPALQGLDSSDCVIYFNTFTRSLAPSMRISYMILPPPLLKRYGQFFSFYSSTVSRFEQHTLHRFMMDGHFERHLHRMHKIYGRRRDAMVSALGGNDPKGENPISILGDSAGLHLLLTVENGMTEAELVARAKEKGIRVYGLSEYYMLSEEQMPRNMVVLGYAEFTESAIYNAIGRLKTAWGVLGEKNY
ncbi:PLP-dependent aminotransferase family protein [Eubacterium barkeri]|uniref:GntR family transcriptional regulator / MocR family aminotransferase n=1 Tax=Eubacterium barkeri TaxID=1528 RepID=A0A1H3BRE5_EUBBA|nr:PLP-dependent aminotransferase family protein [Eubacterium barkeri]SDX43749.1 GntR family transcriptional regulator / MocR family aminotransferase [Eubacterium barkeri]